MPRWLWFGAASSLLVVGCLAGLVAAIVQGATLAAVVYALGLAFALRCYLRLWRLG